MYGEPFARYWVHSYWVTMAGEKMSKSLGNVLSVPAITEHTRPIALRYYLVSVHYRSSIEYSREAFDDAATAFGRIESFLQRTVDRIGLPPDEAVPVGHVPAEFAAAMDDDLGRAARLAVVHDTVRRGNAAARQPGRLDDAAAAAGEVRAMLAVLGLDPFAAPWAGAATSRIRD